MNHQPLGDSLFPRALLLFAFPGRGTVTFREQNVVKQIIRGVTRKVAREVALGVLRERGAKDVQSYLERIMFSRFPQVMSVYGRSERKDAAERVPDRGQ